MQFVFGTYDRTNSSIDLAGRFVCWMQVTCLGNGVSGERMGELFEEKRMKGKGRKWKDKKEMAKQQRMNVTLVPRMTKSARLHKAFCHFFQCVQQLPKSTYIELA